MKYLVDRLLPLNEFSILAGTAGTGKTSLYSWIIKTIQTEDTIFDHSITNKPSFCGVLIMDRPCAGHKLWFELAGIEPHYFSFADSAEPVTWIANSTLTGRIEVLKKLLDQVGGESGPPPPGSLLIIDPFALFAGGDSNNYNKVFPHMILLQRLAAQRQWTIIGVMHGGKQRGKAEDRYVRAQDRLLGSQAFLGCASTIMYLSDVEESGTGKMELCIAPHHAPRMAIQMSRTDQGLVIPAPEQEEVGVKVEYLDQHEQAVLGCLPPEGLAKSAVAAILIGNVMAKATFYRKISQMVAMGLIEEEGGMVRKKMTEGEA